MDRDRIIAAVASVLSDDPHGVLAAWVFGSVARGGQRGSSDIDVGFLLEGQRPRSIEDLPADLHRALESALGREVDVVVLNGAPPDLVHRVLRDGVLVHEADRSARVLFEVHARNQYYDVLPILTRYRRTVLESL